MKRPPATLPAEFVQEMAGALRALGHAYRLRLVERLDLEGPAPGHALRAKLGGAQAALSQHLQKLRQNNILRAERRGKEVWFSLASPAALTLLNCMRRKYRVLAKQAQHPRRCGRIQRSHPRRRSQP
jgi:DNA-binding transcriptional ArsR family regulator